MINIHQASKTVLDALTSNAPAILTGFGAVGVVGTGILAAKAGYEAKDVIRNATLDRINEMESSITSTDDVENLLSRKEKIQLTWMLYLPAATTGTLSVAAIIMSNRISSRRAAMLAAAYALNQDKLEEYQDKIKEKLGVKKEKEARVEIAQAQVNRLGADGFSFADPMAGKVWIMEAYTGRPFVSTVENVKRAANEINHQINEVGAVRLTDFYDEIAQVNSARQKNTLLPAVSTSDYFGFTESNRLELDWSTTTSPDGSLAVHVFEYVNHPVMNPEREAGFR